MKHVAHTSFDAAILSAYRTEAQQKHGERVSERQRVNGRPNGYRPISEAELQRGIEGTGTVTNYASEARAYKPTHGGYSS
ncbi:hypothetical protein UP09_03215 [Bradyrhizobium sp. LTSP885]|uniref:hypothetical protein n=1 Tax=Bradyrhizobium sp. LTSP885 TaxID=1619232 RepID=UPI0005CB16A5|nr:hypothetical protein [Bradyrhizobium sp. LTSP885]KJC51070.1 hypothetical protein UP09_03215 [Bradyrhizobium sp. LTSP885]